MVVGRIRISGSVLALTLMQTESGKRLRRLALIKGRARTAAIMGEERGLEPLRRHGKARREERFPAIGYYPCARMNYNE